MQPAEQRVIDRQGLDELVTRLRQAGYTLIGPVRREAAIVYEEISSLADLPAGWEEEQGPGTYRLKRRDDAALFAYTSSPGSWKRYLFPPELRLWRAQRTDGGWQRVGQEEESRPYAFIGVRACDLHAIQIQDRIFLQGAVPDPAYALRRRGAFIVAVNCGRAGGTCFCASMGTGPRASGGYDLALTEMVGDGRHDFLVEVGTARGAEVLRGVPSRPARAADREAAAAIVARTAAQMGRHLDTREIREVLYRNAEHPRWQETAARCLTCGNCTLACPTCFCHAVVEVTDLAGEHAERWRRWDSCFSLNFSYIHGGSVRASPASRYRQWLVHKLAAWIDQFGTSGCVGCGRCITWCPVGIDITEEVRVLRGEGQAGTGGGKEQTDGDP
jgi:ferredoxin